MVNEYLVAAVVAGVSATLIAWFAPVSAYLAGIVGAVGGGVLGLLFYYVVDSYFGNTVLDEWEPE